MLNSKEGSQRHPAECCSPPAHIISGWSPAWTGKQRSLKSAKPSLNPIKELINHCTQWVVRRRSFIQCHFTFFSPLRTVIYQQNGFEFLQQQKDSSHQNMKAVTTVWGDDTNVLTSQLVLCGLIPHLHGGNIQKRGIESRIRTCSYVNVLRRKINRYGEPREAPTNSLIHAKTQKLKKKT